MSLSETVIEGDDTQLTFISALAFLCREAFLFILIEIECKEATHIGPLDKIRESVPEA